MKEKRGIRVFEKTALEIKDLIRSGYLKVGDSLPGERSLAIKLNISRASVREALRYLQSKNIVITIPGEGSKIITSDVGVISESFSEALNLSQLISLDLMEAREVIEVKNACFAAERAVKSDLRRIEEILNELYKALQENDEDKQEKLDVKFHYAIAKATHNVILIKMFSSISGIMQENMKKRRIAIAEDLKYTRIVQKQHTAIFDAIKKRQCNEASQSMFHHLEDFIDRCILKGLYYHK